MICFQDGRRDHIKLAGTLETKGLQTDQKHYDYWIKLRGPLFYVVVLNNNHPCGLYWMGNEGK